MAPVLNSTRHVSTPSRSGSAAESTATPARSRRPSTGGYGQSDEDESFAKLTLRNLRYLDLHRLPDWPDITEKSWRISRDVAVSQQSRARMAEWVLYRLLEIWDPKETRAKLAPYFPPVEPKQSVTLRSNLYQLLTSLKDSGQLGKDAVLRKTMMDNFKGEKFEEMIFVFSTNVLQKVHAARMRDHSTAAELVFSVEAAKSDLDKLIPLELAYSAKLTRLLEERNLVKTRAEAVKMQLLEKEAVAIERSNFIFDQTEKLGTDMHIYNLSPQRMREELRHTFPQERELLDIILSGEDERERDPLLNQPFRHIWSDPFGHDDLQNDEDHAQSGGSDGFRLVKELDRRLELQKVRLEGWRDFQRTLSKRTEGLLAMRSPTKSPIKSVQTPLNRRTGPSSPVRSIRKKSRSPAKRPTIGNAVVSGVDTPIMKSMEKQNELFDVQQATKGLAGLSLRSTESPYNSSPVLPDTPTLRRRLDRIPSAMSTNSMNSPAGEDRVQQDVPSPMRDADIRSYFKPRSNSPIKHSDPQTQTSGNNTPRSTPTLRSESLQNTTTHSSQSSIERGTVEDSRSPSHVATLSLSERTRQSMMLRPSNRDSGIGDTVTQKSPAYVDHQTSSQKTPMPSVESRVLSETPVTQKETSYFGGLSERTRQSMAQVHLLTSGGGFGGFGQAGARGHRKSRSVQLASLGSYPVNPFGTPTRERAGSVGFGNQDGSNRYQDETNHGDDKTAAATPSMQLDDTDYASVFQTRSKMRHSPPPG